MNLRDKVLIELFCQKLSAQELSPTGIGRHRDNMLFFAGSYLESSEGMELREVDAETIKYFFESWYPTKVKASRTELRRFIATFGKFYKFIHQLGLINRASLEEISGALSKKSHFLAELENRQGENPSPKLENIAAAENRQELDFPFFLDQGLYLLAHNLQKPKLRITLDFQLFLDYLIHHPVRLKPSSATLPKRHLHRLNQMFSEPEDLPANADQNQSRRLIIFYHLARSLDLFLPGSGLELLVTRRAELFLELNPDQQFVVLLDALWNRVRWSELQSFGSQGFAGWAQEHRWGFAELLSRLPAESSEPISGFYQQDRDLKMLANYLFNFEVVESKIMFTLKEMGILDYGLKAGRDSSFLRSRRGVASIKLTKFGKKMMKYLARKGREETGGSSLIDLMEEGLIFL